MTFVRLLFVPGAVLLVCGLLHTFASGQDGNGAVGLALDQIKPSAIRAHVRFLADDLLEGRGTGTRGYQVAAKYVAAHFEALGLTPAGTGDDFEQPVPLRKTTLMQAMSELVLRSDAGIQPLVYATDYLLQGNCANESISLSAPVVFVGFGVTATEFGHDDYANVDVKHKMVAMLSGAPTSFPNDQRAFYSSSAEKLKNAARHGAVAVLDVRTPLDLKRYSWDRLIAQSQMGNLYWLDAENQPHNIFFGDEPEIQDVAIFSASGAAALFQRSAHSLAEVLSAADQGKSASFDLGLSVTIRSSARHEQITSSNVAAVLRGSDPALRDEYVVFTAHLDHLGVGEPVDGDGIYNGAMDNASGVAALLEIAHAFTTLAQPPIRSVMFLAVTGEEAGLLGSDFFVHNPTVPLHSIVANVNIDTLMLIHPFLDVVVFGAEHSTLGAVAERGSSRLGVKVIPDFMPEEVLFIRSDQYSFVRQGIPAVATLGGLETGDSQRNGLAVLKDWIQTVYHTPKDDLGQVLDFGAGARQAQLLFLIGQEMASVRARPQWNQGDFFGRAFGRRQ
ncbi:MAG: M28 family metallopeptidase [Pirellulaceae bacterium]